MERVKNTMDLNPFRQDIDELIAKFAEGESRNLADMKRIWLSRKFSYIYEASPSTNLAFFMQSLYTHAIGYMISTSSLSSRLGGLYCLYCLYETQPFKPPFKIYLSLEELRKLKDLAVVAKENGVKVVSALVKRMLEKNMYFFGIIHYNKGSIIETANQFTELQNARVQVAYKKLFENTQMEDLIHMDMGMEVDLDMLKKMSTEYADAKKLAIKEANEVVDVENIKHISEDNKLIGDRVEEISDEWRSQKELLYQQTGINQALIEYQQQDQDQQLLLLQDDETENFDQELEKLLAET